MVEAFETSDTDRFFNRTKLKYNGFPIFLNRAPEPEDIIWENLTYGFTDKAKRVLGTWIITLIILGICFGINTAISLAMDRRVEEAEDNNESSTNVYGLVFLSAFITILMNRMLALFINKFTKLEKHHTTTEYQISTAFKLAIAMFINTALIPLFINRGTDSFFINGILHYIYIYNIHFRWTITNSDNELVKY